MLLIALLVAQERPPEPDVAAQKERETLIRELFKAEYARTAPADKLKLAKLLMKQAGETKDDPAARFVLLREARDLAAEAGDVETAMLAVDALATSYAVPVLNLRWDALAGAAKAAKLLADHRRVAEALLKVVEEALAAEEIETASKAASAAGAAARKAKDLPLVGRAEALSKDVSELKVKAQAVAAARQKLESTPDDPAANGTVGQYLCFVKGDWESGLRHLAKGPEGKLREQALRDLAGVVGVAEFVALGDGWWDLAEREKGASKDALRARAIHWYERAAPGMSGLNLAKLNQRILTGAPGWMSSGLFGHWKMDEGAGAVARDASPKGRHGRIEGATWAKGRVNGALRFDGGSARVHIDAGELPAPWSAVLWVFPEEHDYPTARLTDPATSKGTSLRLTQAGTPRQAGITQYAVADHAFKYSAPIGRWTQLAWVATDKDLSFYADGALVEVLKQTLPLSVDKLGAFDKDSLKGSLDDVRVYARALSAREVDLLRQAAPKP